MNPSIPTRLFHLITAMILVAGVVSAAPVLAGADPWLEQAKLIAADGATSDGLGFSVALEGDTAVVSARAADVGGNSEQGAAYVFVRVGEDWVEQDKLTASDGEEFDTFGESVAISGDTILVGASQEVNDGPGAAYVFVRDGEEWVQQAKLMASDGAAVEKFGGAVALFGDTALVGARRAKVDGFDNGAAYVFTRDGAGVWSEQVKLVPDDWPFGPCSSNFCPRFGFSVALWEDTALVGAERMEVDGVDVAGAAYVFIRETESWTQQAMLRRPVAGFNERFGTSVALHNDTAVVGAPLVDVNGNSDQGVVHVFARDEVTWTGQQELVASDGASSDQFGTSVALSDGVALTGSLDGDMDPGGGGGNHLQGAAYRFTLDGGSWSEQQKFTASDGAASDLFGTSAALSGSTALVGAPRAAIDGNSDQGAAYVFIGQETGAPDLILDPAGLDFGEVEVGTTSAPQTATLSNSGDGDATGLTFNTPGNGFGVNTTDCGESLPVGNDCQVSVTFTPAATGAAAATLTVDSDQAVSADLALNGAGIEPAQLSFSPPTLDFGAIEVGTTSEPLDATLSNTGDTDTTGLNFSTPGSGFAVVTNECGTGLPAGQSCLLSLTFAPASAGPASDTLTVEDDAGASAGLDLAGNGEAPPPEPGILSVEPAELDFGTVEVGSDEILSVTVSNAAEAGAESLTLSTLDLDGGGVGGGDPATILVSLDPDGNQIRRAAGVVMNNDGRYITFVGKQCLTCNDIVYRRDLLTGTTEVVSVREDGGMVGLADVAEGDIAISADGQYVLYVSNSQNSPPIPDGPRGIYIRDMDAGVTEFLDIPTTDGELPDGGRWPNRIAISADARILVFESQSTNLLPGGCFEYFPGPNEGCTDVYAYDRDAETLERVSTAFDGSTPELWSQSHDITPDGRYVTFISPASNLVPDDTNDKNDVFVHDRDTGVTERVSVAADGSEANDNSSLTTNPAISADGRYVAFRSRATNLVPDNSTPGHMFVRDRVAGTTELVSVASDGTPGNDISGPPVAISADGRFVTFRSVASNLVPDDFNGRDDHFVHDRLTGMTERISVRTDGTEGNRPEFQARPAISTDGRFVAFSTHKTLVLDDMVFDAPNMYLRDRGGQPPNPAFAITGGDCAVDTMLQPGDSCTVEITFTPNSAGVFEDMLIVETDDEQSASVTLQGAGQGPLPDSIFEDRFEEKP